MKRDNHKGKFTPRTEQKKIRGWYYFRCIADPETPHVFKVLGYGAKEIKGIKCPFCGSNDISKRIKITQHEYLSTRGIYQPEYERKLAKTY
jgi:hypothetical protein